jgi:tRNA threonylcarbamoyl adenosine modification protein (Sua5/YciO/YrdC/YwlC family)
VSELRAARAVTLLRDGAVVALATDTVYGLAASLAHPSALTALFALKRRPGNVALPVLVDGVAQIEALGVTWPAPAARLSDALWPGALTIVVPAPASLARLVGSTRASVGFRCPGDDELRRLLGRTGPLAVSSANEHGEAPCTTAAQVRAAFADRPLAGVLDGGVRDGAVSTVVELVDDSWRVRRDGAVAREVLADLLGQAEGGSGGQ